MGKHDITRLIQRGVDVEEIENYVEHMDDHENHELTLRLLEREVTKGRKKKKYEKKKPEFADRRKREISLSMLPRSDEDVS